MDIELLDTIGGLPVHPLVVHLVVVLLPLSALGLIALVVFPRWRGTFGWLTMGGLTAGALAAVAAASSGEALADRVGEPERHAELGETLEIVALALLAAGWIWFLLERRNAVRGGGTPRMLGSGLQLVASLAVLALAIGALALTVLVGHSGAQAVWEGRVGSTSVDAEEDEDW
ncbi:MAG: DUF2231 domain-containing protein [Actinomycetota bacterium]